MKLTRSRSPITTFRFDAETLDDLDTIRDWLTDERHSPQTRAEAARWAFGELAKKIRKKSSEKA